MKTRKQSLNTSLNASLNSNTNNNSFLEDDEEDCIPKICKLCEQSGAKPIHQAMTFQLDEKVRRCAQMLNDNSLPIRIGVGDLIATEFTYHIKCLVDLYCRANTVNQ